VDLHQLIAMSSTVPALLAAGLLIWGCWRDRSVPRAVPVLEGVLAWLVCALEQELDGGDHAILVGRPLEAGGDQDAQPLVFFDGRYFFNASAVSAAPE